MANEEKLIAAAAKYRAACEAKNGAEQRIKELTAKLIRVQQYLHHQDGQS
jgi:hypothetical protein